MEKFQIVEVTEGFNHAGTKATKDVAVIADRLGFKRINVKMDTNEESVIGKIKRQIGYFRDWKEVQKTVPENSIVLLQHPFHYKQLTRESVLKELKSKNVKIISVVHDVEKLRAFRYNQYYEHEFQTMLEIADAIIVHNDVMLRWFIEQGVEERKLISLEIFDYLQDGEKEKTVVFEKSITVAGNLDTEKCGYVAELDKLGDVTVNLYGPNFNEKLRASEHIIYHGSFPVDEIPNKLDRGFGLVWDGESIEGCTGLSGQYLRYNNPHKLSLYLSSGLPVVIWKEAAEARFVEKNDVGIVVDSVLEADATINNMQIEKWNNISQNITEISKKLRTGFYFTEALKKALNVV